MALYILLGNKYLVEVFPRRLSFLNENGAFFVIFVHILLPAHLLSRNVCMYVSVNKSFLWSRCVCVLCCHADSIVVMKICRSYGI